MSDDAGSPAERLLFERGQLYRLHEAGALPVEPKDFEVLDLARIIGVARRRVRQRLGTLALFRDVLVVDPGAEFPWRIYDDFTWAMLEEASRV